MLADDLCVFLDTMCGYMEIIRVVMEKFRIGREETVRVGRRRSLSVCVSAA